MQCCQLSRIIRKKGITRDDNCFKKCEHLSSLSGPLLNYFLNVFTFLFRLTITLLHYRYLLFVSNLNCVTTYYFKSYR